MAEPADAHRGSLRDFVEKLLPLGGVPSSERIREAVGGLVSAGKLSPEAADELIEELAGARGPRLTGRASGAVSGLADQLGLVRERQLEELELRVAQLEHRLRLLEASADGARTPPG